MAAGALLGLSLATTAIGTGISAASTLAGGAAAQEAGDLRAQQLRQNADTAVASAQQRMFDTQRRTRLAISTATARAGASGVAPDVGSPLANTSALAQRGSYQALMDLWGGQAEASGLQNQAAEAEWEGATKQQASELSAGGTLAGGLGNMFQTYGAWQYPTQFGRAMPGYGL